MTLINETTAFIHVESGAYPLTLNSLRARHTNISFVSGDDVGFFREQGYEIVHPTIRPEGDVVVEIAPYLREDGKWLQTFEARSFNEDEILRRLNEKKDEFIARCNELRTSALEVGVGIDFGGDSGVQHIQMRNSDRSNILDLKARGEMLLAKGITEGVMGVRSYENRTVILTPQKAIDMSWLVFDGYSETMQKSWDVIDAAKAATTEEGIPELPTSFSPTQRSLVEVPAE